MAARFWVGGTGNWDASTTTNWSTTSGGGGGAAVPTSSDDVTFDTLSNATAYTVTITATANCASLTIGNPLVGSLTLAGSAALSVYGSFNIANITRTYTGAITFRATTTGKTLTFNGETMASATTFDGVGGGWTVQDAWNNGASNIVLTNGSLDTNAQTITCATLSTDNSNTRTLNITNSTLNVTHWASTTTTNITFTSTGSTVNLTPSGSADVGNLTFNTFAITLSANLNPTFTASGASFGTFSFTTTTSKIGNLQLGSNITVTGTITITGNSVTNRALISSSTKGTARTISAATVTVTNADFQDITGAGAGSWNLSAITGLSGDCGGNSGITFTTAATQTATGTVSFTWSTHGWTSRVPLPQDDVVINNAFGVSQSITADMPRLGKSIDFTGVTWTTSLGFANSVACSLFGSLTLVSGMTVSGGGGALTFEGRSTYTLTSAACTWNKSISVEVPGGTLTLQDTLTSGTSRTLTVSYGTFNANNQNITFGAFSSTNANTRTITMGSGTWELTGTSTIWNTGTATNLTLNANTATIALTTNTASSRTISSSSAVRLPDIDVTAGTGAVGTSTVYCNSIDFTGFSGSWGTAVLNVAGNFTLSATMTVTDGANVTTFSATSGTKLITLNGVTVNRPLTFDGVGGTWELQDALVGNSSRRIIVSNGHLDFNDQNVTIGLLTVSSGATATFGAMTLELTGTGSTTTNINGSAIINAGLSTIKVTDSSASDVTLGLGALTYHNLWWARGASAGSNTISGNNTFNDIRDTGSAAHSMIFTNSTTTQLVTFTISGTPGNLITLNSSGTAIHTLVKLGGGIISCDYLNIQHSVATPGAWYAGLNSVNNQAVATAGSGWIFNVPPIPNEQQIASQAAVRRVSRY